MLTQTAVDELRTIWEKHSGESVSNQEAWEMATRLMTLYDILAAPAVAVTDSVGIPKS